MPRTGKASLTRPSCYRRTLAEVIERGRQAVGSSRRCVARPVTREDETMRLDKAARSILLTEFVSAFFLAMRYFFKPKATLNYPFEKGRSHPAFAASLRC